MSAPAQASPEPRTRPATASPLLALKVAFVGILAAVGLTLSAAQFVGMAQVDPATDYVDEFASVGVRARLDADTSTSWVSNALQAALGQWLQVDFDKPVRSAIFARVQCVAFGGVDSKVATITSST